ncbi:hypothetical protein KR100_03710 [Synechococcus sp. KORDI-100]|nr:hypothetical protein KR100_03710 [Synechococcus sp. KORDI-100]
MTTSTSNTMLLLISKIFNNKDISFLFQVVHALAIRIPRIVVITLLRIQRWLTKNLERKWSEVNIYARKIFWIMLCLLIIAEMPGEYPRKF